MKANELMLRDWVNVTAAENIVRPDILSILPKKGKVVGIDGDCIYVDFVEHPFMLGDIEPIPLTPEILEKNGFKECQYWHEYKDGDVIIQSCQPDIRMKKGEDTYYRGECKFVHELQHALRLCGIEKEIEL